LFHNNCLNEYCESQRGNIVCPICRSDLEYSCFDVWAFKEKNLGSDDNSPLFEGNKYISDIYYNQQAGKKQKTKFIKTKTKKSKTKKSKTKKTKTKKIKKNLQHN
jgi:hypothetical protein